MSAPWKENLSSVPNKKDKQSFTSKFSYPCRFIFINRRVCPDLSFLTAPHTLRSCSTVTTLASEVRRPWRTISGRRIFLLPPSTFRSKSAPVLFGCIRNFYAFFSTTLRSAACSAQSQGILQRAVVIRHLPVLLG